MVEDFDVLFEEELRNQILKIGQLTPGSKEHSEAVDSFSKLYRLKIEEDRNVSESRFKDDQLVDSWKSEAAKTKERFIDRWINAGMSLLSIGLPLMHNSKWMGKVLKFEETGSITSPAGREVFKRIFRK